MDIDCARKLLNKFNGFIRLDSYQYYEEDTGYQGYKYGLDKHFCWWYYDYDDECLIDSGSRDIPFDFFSWHFIDKNWLYYNDKFECLTCETCYKLLKDMDGLAPVCECATGVKIGDTVKVTVKDIAMMHSIKCQQCDKYKKSLSDNVEWCQCGKDGWPNQKAYEAAQEKSDKLFDKALREMREFIDVLQFERKMKPQYPGMIEVNYLMGPKAVHHYTNLEMFILKDRFYVLGSGEQSESAVRLALKADHLSNINLNVGEVSAEEYHRILNLFKASGLEVTE